MSQLTIKLSAKADALIAQLQKEIFNRRRKKITASGVVETLVESGAKSQSDKRYATSWSNLIKDIEKAAKLTNNYGAKPSALSNEEWAIILSYRTRNSKGTSYKTKHSTTTTVKRKATKHNSTKNSSSKHKTSSTKTSLNKSPINKNLNKGSSHLKVITKKPLTQMQSK